MLTRMVASLGWSGFSVVVAPPVASKTLNWDEVVLSADVLKFSAEELGEMWSDIVFFVQW